jgi:hypothetical protein
MMDRASGIPSRRTRDRWGREAVRKELGIVLAVIVAVF